MSRLPAVLSGLLVAFAVLNTPPVAAQSGYEPKRGTAERKQLMNAIRPFAEEKLGKPVQFVVKDLIVNGSVGYAALHAQRPGGKQIDMRNTPDARQYGYDENMYPGIYALYTKQGGRWVLSGASYSPFEPPFMGPEVCATHGAVLNPGWC
ncbi:MAG: hypothetical protein AAFV19_14415 [Pseudomonadota bacterium]